MGIIVIIALLIYLILSGYVIVKSFREGKKTLSILSFLFIVVSALIELATFIFKVSLTYPLGLLLIFLFGNLLLLITIVITKKSGGKQYVLFVLSFLFSISVCSAVTFMFSFFGEKVLLKLKLSDGIYLNSREYFDNGYKISYISIENSIFVKRRLSSNCDPWNTLDEVKFISLKDSILVYTIRTADVKDTIEINLRFDNVANLINGVSVVRLGDKSGAIDSIGKIIIPIGKYQSLTDNHGNLMLAQKDGKWGYINKEDKVVIPFTFNGGGNFLSDSTTVQIGTKYYYINKKGKLLREYKP